MNKTGVDVKVYLTFVEHDWVKKQKRGYIRRLVQADMKHDELELSPGDELVIPTYVMPPWAS